MGLNRWHKKVVSNNFYFEIAKRNVGTHFIINKFGENISVVDSLVTIWDAGGLYSYMPSASFITLSSGSTSDTLAGTGAQKVKVYGLDENYNAITEIVELNGQNAVSTINQYIRVFRLIVIQAGSNGSAVGIIYAGTGTVSLGVPANIYAQILIGNNQTLMCVYTISAGYTGYIISAGAAAGTGKDATLSIVIREFGSNVFNVKSKIILIAGNVVRDFHAPFIIPAKTDVEIRGISDAAGAPVTATFDIVLVKENNSVVDLPQ